MKTFIAVLAAASTLALHGAGPAQELTQNARTFVFLNNLAADVNSLDLTYSNVATA